MIVASIDEARAVWVLTPRNTAAELEAWRLAYEASVGPAPAGSVRLPERNA